METPEKMAKIIILLGIVLVVFGSIFFFVSKSGWSFKLPGDIYYKKNNFSFYFPITTSIIISLLISFLLNILKK